MRTIHSIALAMTISIVVGAQGANATTACLRGWEASPLPNAAQLTAIDATSGNDAWAMGSAFTSQGQRVVAEHFDGASWTQAEVAVEAPYVAIRTLTMDSPVDGWAGGLTEQGVGGGQMLALHWDGSAWARTPLYAPGPMGVNGFSALSPGNVWAVGEIAPGARINGAAFHWDGTAWSRVPLPALGHDWWLSAVLALSPRDVWAAGDSHGKALMLHFDGSGWTRAAVPATARRQAPIIPRSLIAVAGTVLAVGTQGSDICCEESYLLKWDGSAWQAASDGNTSPTWGADVQGAGIWAVGGWPFGGATVSHFDGSWATTYPLRHIGPDLDAIAAVPGGAWAVGSVYANGAPNWALRTC